jgi:integrase
MTQTAAHRQADIATSNKPQPAKLLDRVRAAIRAHHYSLRTEEAYVGWVRRFILFHHKRHPAEMGEPEINQFLTHLAVVENVAASTQNQTLSGILFLYQEVLGRDLDRIEGIVRAKKPKRLPVVLTRDEVRAVLTKKCRAPRSFPLFCDTGVVCGCWKRCACVSKTSIWEPDKSRYAMAKDRGIIG